MAVQEDIGGIHGDVLVAHKPDALIVARLAPGILHHIIFSSILVDGLAIDQHHMVVSGIPRVKTLLA